jgi:tRNA pseudouridine65 synthase
MNHLAILHQDEHIIAIHKPAGMLIHRSPISRDTVFVLQTLRDQIGQRVYPIHRLDRATSGALVFGLNPEMAKMVTQQFENHLVEKEYRALVRGWVDDSGQIDHPITDEDGNRKAQNAVTDYRCLQKIELPFAVDRYPSTRYSLVSVSPQTGRRQQIRKHFKHISHHLIGDTTHGNGKHNRFFREQYDIHRLMLTSHKLCLDHPVTQQRLCFKALTEPEWVKVFSEFKWRQ